MLFLLEVIFCKIVIGKEKRNFLPIFLLFSGEWLDGILVHTILK
jgi:hypothetical protein